MRPDAPPFHTRRQLFKTLALYYGIACGFAWLAWTPLALGPAGLKLHHHPISLPVSACVGTLGPFLACFLCHRLETGNWRAVRLLPQNRWQMIWLLLGPLFVLFCFFVLFPALLSQGNPRGWHWHVAALSTLWLHMFNYNLLGGPLFEEFGWRGFLQPHLQEVMPPWIASILTGILWAAWHFPLFLVGFVSASPLVFTFITVGLSMIMAFAFNASGKAVVVAILMHSAFNASSEFLPNFLGSTPTREHPSAEVLIGLAFWIGAIATIILTRGQLSAPTRVDAGEVSTIAAYGTSRAKPGRV